MKQFSRLLARSFPRMTSPTIFHNKTQLARVGLGVFGLSLSSWFTTTKIFNEEIQILETEDNLIEGEVREVLVGPKPEDTILVINYQGEIYATQSKCAHFGFDLKKGLLVGDKLICPLHNAAFSIKTGGEEQGPVFNGLRTFKVERIDGVIRIQVPKNSWSNSPQYP